MTASLTFPSRFLEVMSNPVNVLEGSVWGAILVSDTVGLVNGIKERCWENIQQGQSADKPLFFVSCSWIGSLANFMSWASSVSLISLGELAKTVSGVGYISRILTSGLNCLEAIHQSASFRGTPHEGKLQVLAMLKLAAHATLLAWAALGLMTFAITTAEILLSMDILFFTCCALFIGEIFYRQYLQKNQILPKKAFEN